MEKQIITFSANEQTLTKTGGVDCYASNTVAYIEARFDLGDNWSGYDSVRAVWFTDFVGGISTVLDSLGTCIVPYEVLTRKGEVKINLVGSISNGEELTDRLTTCPVVALKIKCNAKITGTETAAITPSQFEQFVDIVKADADRAETAKEGARVYAGNALSSAQNALASETNAHTSEVNAKGSEDNAKLSELNAEAYKNQAEISAQSASESADEAEAWAVGQRGGVDVEETDETYHNNSKYYAEQAGASNATAETYAASAKESERKAAASASGISVDRATVQDLATAVYAAKEDVEELVQQAQSVFTTNGDCQTVVNEDGSITEYWTISE